MLAGGMDWACWRLPDGVWVRGMLMRMPPASAARQEQKQRPRFGTVQEGSLSSGVVVNVPSGHVYNLTHYVMLT